MGTSINTWASVINSIIDGSLNIGSPMGPSVDNEVVYMTDFMENWSLGGCAET